MKKILLFALMAYWLMRCTENPKSAFTYNDLVNKALDSISKSDTSLTGLHLVLNNNPDGLGNIVLEYYSYSYPEDKDSIMKAMRSILFSKSTFDFTPDKRLSFKIHESESDKYERNGALHVSDPAYYYKRTGLCLYISFLCGNHCAKGYIVLYGLDQKKGWVLRDIRNVWH